MDETLRPGDLAWVIKPSECCGNASKVGAIVTLLARAPAPAKRCIHCKRRSSTVGSVMVSGAQRTGAISRARLKKIHPLKDLEDQSVDQSDKIPSNV